VAVALLVLVMIVVIVVVDLLFLRDHAWLRLLVNLGIVAAFGALYIALRDRL
jgi:hypothetical protein